LQVNGITNVGFVGDRGMITTKRIKEDLRDVDGLELLSTHASPEIVFSFQGFLTTFH